MSEAMKAENVRYEACKAHPVAGLILAALHAQDARTYNGWAVDTVGLAMDTAEKIAALTVSAHTPEPAAWEHTHYVDYACVDTEKVLRRTAECGHLSCMNAPPTPLFAHPAPSAAPCPYVYTSGEGTSHCRLAASAASPPPGDAAWLDDPDLRDKLWYHVVEIRDAKMRVPDDADTWDIVERVLNVIRAAYPGSAESEETSRG